jgi:hypothetical protein
MASVAQGRTTPMTVNKRRLGVLVVCLLAVALGAVVLPGSHLLFDAAVLVAAVLTLVLTRGRRSKPAKVKQAQGGASGTQIFGLRLGRKTSRLSELWLSVEALRGELSAHQQLTAAQQQLSMALTEKVEQFAAVRRAMYLELEQRLSSVELNQETELARLREIRDRHQQSMSKLAESIDAHKRELVNLSEALQLPAAELPQPAVASSSF